MKSGNLKFLDFEIDKITRSIENTKTGDSFQTDISTFTYNDTKTVTKKNRWLFDWKWELNQNDREVLKLTIANNPHILQGLMSLTPKMDNVYLHLIESAPFNRGKDKIYMGVPGNLVAYACKLSFMRGTEGYVSFLAKSKLVSHYTETLGAIHAGRNLMIISTSAAQKLVDQYFKN